MFHKRVAIDIGNREFVVLQIEIDKEAKEFASCQARHKALHTSNADQSGLNRGQLLKDSKQYSGCLSEMAVEYFLELIVSEERRLHVHIPAHREHRF